MQDRVRHKNLVCSHSSPIKLAIKSPVTREQRKAERVILILFLALRREGSQQARGWIAASLQRDAPALCSQVPRGLFSTWNEPGRGKEKTQKREDISKPSGSGRAEVNPQKSDHTNHMAN